MKIKILIENTAPDGLCREHGLSVYINYNNIPILLDGGSSGEFLENADKLGVDITKIKLAVLSHGHYDHGDGLAAFLRENKQAAVYFRPAALAEHWSDNGGERHYIGLSGEVKDLLAQRGRQTEEAAQIFPGVWLIPDEVAHEQSLVLEGEKELVIFNSCCHAGVQQAGADSEDTVMGVLVRRRTVIFVFACVCPVCACATVNGEVVDATGFVTANPVGQVDHNVGDGAEVVEFLFVQTVDSRLVTDYANSVGGVGETFGFQPAEADTDTNDGREPLAYIKRGSGRPTVFPITMNITGREEDVRATFSRDKPVVLKTIEEIALSGILYIRDFLCALGHHVLSQKCSASKS